MGTAEHQNKQINIAIFYGSTYGGTAEAARKIGNRIEQLGLKYVLKDIAHSKVAELQDYDKLLLGCSTWNVGELQDDWDRQFKQLDGLDLSGKQVALFGTGDQLGYGDSFQDAFGILGEKLEQRGASLVGLWPVLGYEHYKSRGQRGEHFMGLALDDDNQAHQTDSRIEQWVSQVLKEFGLPSGADLGLPSGADLGLPSGADLDEKAS
jgi:flavodoxin I